MIVVRTPEELRAMSERDAEWRRWYKEHGIEPVCEESEDFKGDIYIDSDMDLDEFMKQSGAVSLADFESRVQKWMDEANETANKRKNENEKS